jgi:hypothetical protein
LILACLVASGIRGQDAPPQIQRITIQRIKIPKGRVDDIEKIEGKALPLRREKFEQRIAELNKSYRARHDPVGSRIVRARYSAELQSEQLVNGTAELEIKHTRSTPGYADLAPAGLALGSLRWIDDQTPADAGLTDEGRLVLSVERSGTLGFRWSLRGRYERPNQLDFRMSLPEAAASEMRLDIPAGWRPICPQGLVTLVETPATENGDASPAVNRWLIELGSANTVLLRIVPNEASNLQRLVVASPNFDYHLDPAGLELLARWHLDVHHHPVDRLLLRHDPTIRIASARHGDEAVTISRRADSETPDAVVLHLPTPILGRNIEIEVTAFAKLTLEERWQLPRLQLVDTLWRRGTTTLDVIRPLSVSRLRWTSALLRDRGPVPGPLSGESRAFDLFSPDASQEVLLKTTSPQISSDSVTGIEINESTVTAQFVAHLSNSSEVDAFSLRLRQDANWIIDSVETEPPNLSTEDLVVGTRGVSTIQLAEPITPDRPIKLVVKAHRQTPNPITLTGIEMRPVQLVGIEQQSSLIAVKAVAPLQIETLRDAAIERVRSQELSKTQRDLLVDHDGGLIYRDGPEADRLRLVLRSEPPRFIANMSVDAIAEAGALELTYLLRCVPQSSQISRVRVLFSQPIESAIHWTIVGESTGPLSARRLDDDGREWEITLRRPKPVGFDIRARHSMTLSETTPIALVAVPDAASQLGTIVVRTTDGTPLTIQQQGLKSIPSADEEFTSLRTIRAAFRYPPSQTASLTVGKQVESASPSRAWVWSADLNSRLDSNGVVSHDLLYRVENAGARAIAVEVPPSGSVQQLLVDGQPQEWPQGSAATVALPPDKRFPTIRLLFRQQGPALRSVRQVQPLWPVIDLPCLARSWNLLIPPGYTTSNNRVILAGGGDRQLEWEERLFGYSLIRRTGLPWSFSNNWRQTWSPLARQGPTTTQQLAEDHGSPWRRRSIGAETKQLAGWNNVRVAVSEANSVAVTVYRSTFASGLGWAAFFSATSIGLWGGRRHTTWRMLLIVSSGVVALLVPSGVVFIPRAVFLGFLTATALLVLRRSPAPNLATPEDSFSIRVATKPISAAMLLLLALLGAFLLAELATAQDASGQDASAQEADDAPPPPSIYRIYDPIDEDGEPAGTRYYVPPKLTDALGRLERELTVQRSGWLLTSASYSLQLPPDMAAAMLPQTLVAEYEVVTFAEGSIEVELPFRRTEVEVIQAKLGEQQIIQRWSEDGDRLLVEIDTPGRHQLQMTLRPEVSVRGGRQGIAVHIPPTPVAQLIVTAPDVSAVDPVSAKGALRRVDGQLQAQLGPTDQLDVRWPRRLLAEPSPLEYTASQLLWLRVEPNNVVLDTQLKLSVLRGRLSHIELAVDPRLQLLPFDPAQPIKRFAIEDGPTRKIRLDLDRGYEASEDVEIAASFILPVALGTDVLKGPTIQLSSGQASESLLGISTVSALDAQLIHDDVWTDFARQDFASRWNSPQTPDLAFELPNSQAGWSIAVQLKEPQLSADEELDLTIGRGQADLVYYSWADATEAQVSQLELATPDGLEISGISVIQDDVDLVQKWASDEAGTTTVFLIRPVGGELRLSLSATTQVPRRGEFSFDGVFLRDAVSGNRMLRVFRSATTLVDLKAHAGFRRRDPTPNESPSFARERLVAVLDAEDSSGKADRRAILEVSPNQARFEGELITTLRHDSSGWIVEAELSIRTLAGVVDSIRLNVPRAFTESYELDPPLAVKVENAPGQTRANLIITPPDVIREDFSVRFKAPLAPTGGARVSAPQIKVLDTNQVQRFLVLPKRVGDQSVEWNTSGLDTPVEDDQWTTYHIRGRRMNATVREVAQTTSLPRVLLADLQIALALDGSYQGVATFDLDPANLTECDLEVPGSVHLLNVSVDGLPALRTQQDSSTWRVQLAAEQLPQRMDVVFRGQTSSLASRDEMIVAAPTLLGWEIAKTLWNVHGSENGSELTALLVHAQADSSEFQSIRTAAIERILEQHAGVVPQHRPADLDVWRARWQRRLTSGRMSALENGSGARDLWQPNALHHANSIYCQFDGAAPTLTLVRHNLGKADYASRGLVALSLCALAGLMLLLRRSDALWSSAERWPHLIGVAIGIVWWLCLVPSIIGWLIVAVCLLGALLPAWGKQHVFR